MANDVRKWDTVKTDSKGKARMDDVTFCFPIVRQDMICNALRSLHRYTKGYSYKTVVMNMSVPNREFEDELYGLCDVVIRPHVNYGFAQSASIMMRIAPTPYISIVNDDVEFCYEGWFDGILETFEKFPAAAAVNPQSPKEPGWGWGEPGYRYLVPKPFLKGNLKKLYNEDRRLMERVREVKKAWEEFQKGSVRDTDTGKQLLAKLEGRRRKYQETQEELEERILVLSHDRGYIDALIEEKKWMVVDAFAAWCSTFRADALADIGLFDERFVPGGSEDYTWMYDCYKKEYRALSTSRSLVNHFWGRTKDTPGGLSTALPLARPAWNCLSTKGFGDRGLFSPDCSVWAEDWSVRVDPEIYRAPL